MGLPARWWACWSSASSTGSSSCPSPLRQATDLHQATRSHPHKLPLRKLLQRRATPAETPMQEVMLVVMLVEVTVLGETVLEEMMLPQQHKQAILKIDSILCGREDQEDFHHWKSPLPDFFCD